MVKEAAVMATPTHFASVTNSPAARVPRRRTNVQFVLPTKPIDGTAGPPRVLATRVAGRQFVCSTNEEFHAPLAWSEISVFQQMTTEFRGITGGGNS